MTNLQDYLRFLWHDTEGVVHLAYKGVEPNDWHSTLFKWPQEEKGVIQYIQKRTPHHEVFVNPVIYKDEGIRDRTAFSRENVLGTWTLWADFDGNAPSSWNGTGGIPEPSVRIVTSTESHQHCYWQLDELVTDPEIIEAKNRTIAYELDADKSGWDYSQLLRPPDTTNHGYGKDRRGRVYDVRFEETDFGKSYTPTFIVENDKYKPIVSFYPAHENIPEITRVLSSHSFNKAFVELLHTDAIPVDRSGAIFRLGCLAAEQGLTDPEIYSVMNYADSRFGKYVGRKDHDRRLVDMLNSVRKRIPFGTGQINFGGLFDDVEDSPQSGFMFGEFLNTKIDFQWHMEGLLPKNGYLLMYGAPGVGKTLLSMDLVNKVMTGKDWMGFANKMGARKVLFLSLEMNLAMLHEQYTRMTTHMDQDEVRSMHEMMKIYPLAETLPLDKPEGRNYLSQILSDTEFHPDLVLVDSMSELSERSLLDDEAARNLNRFLRHIRNRHRVSVCLVHHNRKSGRNASHSDIDDMWGSRFLGAGADSILFFEDTYPPSDRVRCYHDKSRMSARTEPFIIMRDWDTFQFSHDGVAESMTIDERKASDLSNDLRRAATRKDSPDPAQ